MNKEQLIALGLTEEQADKVIAGFGQMIPKSRFDEVNQAKKQLEQQLNERDKQLKDLEEKAKGNEELTKQIKELQDANKQAKADYEKQLKDLQVSTAIKLALVGKVHDEDLVAGLIDKTKIELSEDGKITKGFDEQIKSLQESKAFLFIPEKQQQSYLKGFKPVDGQGAGGQQPGGETSFGEKAAEFVKTNNNLEAARKSYFE